MGNEIWFSSKSDKDCSDVAERPISIVWVEPLLNSSDLAFALKAMSEFKRRSLSSCIAMAEVIVLVYPDTLSFWKSESGFQEIHSFVANLRDSGILVQVMLPLGDPRWSLERSELSVDHFPFLRDLGIDGTIVCMGNLAPNEIRQALQAGVDAGLGGVTVGTSLGLLSTTFHIVEEFPTGTVDRLYYELTNFWVPNVHNYSDPFHTPMASVGSPTRLLEFLVNSTEIGSPIPATDIELLKAPPLPTTIVFSVRNPFSRACWFPTAQTGCSRSTSESVEFGAQPLAFFLRFLSELEKFSPNSLNFAINSLSEMPTSWIKRRS